MDVKYRPEPWQNMGDGMNRITKDALIKLREANESLKRIDGRIRDLDSDGSIHFNPKDQSQKIGELLDSYSTLQKYCGEAGRLVSEHIDKPFLVEMDKFAQKMRDTSILSFETNNRIGSTTTTVLPGAHAGYGSVPQTIQKKKDKITVEDIFRDSPAFDNVLRAEYKELKKQNPDAKLNYEEYKKVVPSTRGFEYKSIEDEQKKLEMVRDIGIGVGIIITTILCPPLGTAAAVVYGAVQIKSGIDGEDWGTHRKLSQEERTGNIIFGGLDAIPAVGLLGKGVKAFKGTSELADLAKLLKFKEGMPGFNPNLGKNVVQSLKENKTLKNALDAMKNTPIPVAVRTVDTGIGMKLPYIESSTVGEVAGKFSKASTAAKDDAYQFAKGSGGSGVSKEGSVAKGTGNKEETFTVPKWSNDGKYDKVRGYRGRDLTKYDEEYLVDPRLVVEMNFKGKTNSGTNAAGWERNAKKFFNTLLKSNPEFWSAENTALIKRGRVPIVDEQFIKYFPQYKEYIKDPMRHHHIGEGGQAVALPKSLHPGYGGIHNVEKEWGITGIDDEIATRLETFINNLRR
ncbi:hypothetical protein [Bacillus cereus]|uniref:hypothetical protein n=1 Tax=Bacillus cereus TaxID=1396 RepID=UPI000BF682C6|nr:hypothetical protein [Bacillus cereus]MDG1566982.1 hypothetical protein [Bacillus cereus]PEX24830.1 hypothetical protein CN458_20520 [Bacillus cereus]PFT89585.1 hypothetical protein COK66_20615 [Bacillus cereus]PGO96110.1 hypothetical protein COA03_16395 [Bacillus cereus]